MPDLRKFLYLFILLLPLVGRAEFLTKVDYTHDSFSDDLDSWDALAASLGITTPYGTIIPRLNFARRFATQGTQVELDAYPRLLEGRYAYLNFGYSESSIFPRYRLGAEVFQSLPLSFEVSAGFRRLWFESSSPTIWTASVATYVGPYYLAIRPFFVPKEAGDSWSGFVEIRRYHGDLNYFTIKAGEGEYSDQEVSTLEIFRLHSQWAALGV